MEHTKIKAIGDINMYIEYSPMVDIVTRVEICHEAEGRRVIKEIAKVWNAHDELVRNLKIAVNTLEFYDTTTTDNAGMRKEAIRIAKTFLKSLEK